MEIRVGECLYQASKSRYRKVYSGCGIGIEIDSGQYATKSYILPKKLKNTPKKK